METETWHVHVSVCRWEVVLFSKLFSLWQCVSRRPFHARKVIRPWSASKTFFSNLTLTIHPANTGTPTHTHNHTPTQTHRHPHNICAQIYPDIPRRTHTHPDTHTNTYTHTHSIHANPPAHTHTRTHIASIRTRAHRATTHIPGIHLPVILVRKNDRKM